jgi:hypothetical protein
LPTIMAFFIALYAVVAPVTAADNVMGSNM